LNDPDPSSPMSAVGTVDKRKVSWLAKKYEME
jgi:hypothetical protein